MQWDVQEINILIAAVPVGLRVLIFCTSQSRLMLHPVVWGGWERVAGGWFRGREGAFLGGGQQHGGDLAREVGGIGGSSTHCILTPHFWAW